MKFMQLVSETCDLFYGNVVKFTSQEDSRLPVVDIKKNCSKTYCARKNEIKCSGSGVCQNGMYHICQQMIYEVELKCPKYILLLFGTVFV